MTNLFNLGRRGLEAAQMGLNTTGHNITNVNTPGYSRQQAMVSTTPSQGTSAGHVGTGVKTDTVRRIYDGFLTSQVQRTTADHAATEAYVGQMSRINNLLADRTVGIAPALASFFEGVNAVASQPAEPAARQELLGRADSLVSQITTTQSFLQEQHEGVNRQVETTVQQINSYASRIQELNQQIISASASVVGHAPNDLLDQRDQLVTELNSLIQVTVVPQGNAFNITVGNGQTLVSGGRSYPLEAVRSAADPERMAVAYTTASGVPVELSDSVLRGGQLGGLLQYRQEVLDVTQNQLGQLTLGLALSFNAQHAQGADLNGEPGQDFFSLGTQPMLGLGHARNADPSVSVSYTFADDAAGQITASDYTLSFSATEGYRLTRLSDGAVFVPDDPQDLATLEADGLVFDAPAQPLGDGDRFLIQPTRHAARDIRLALSDPASIAASAYDPADPDVSGSSNGDNALAMAQLQTNKVLGRGTMSVTESFSQLVNGIGVKAQSANSALAAQSTLKAQAFQAQQSVSGVNLNEEYINLDFYVMQYSASARMIDVGTSIFDTILGLGRR